MQFQTDSLPTGMILPALQDARITVAEEDGVVCLMVARAQGLIGEVMVGYRTIPFTASSPEDYQVFLFSFVFLPMTNFKNKHTKEQVTWVTIVPYSWVSVFFKLEVRCSSGNIFINGTLKDTRIIGPFL